MEESILLGPETRPGDTVSGGRIDGGIDTFKPGGVTLGGRIDERIDSFKPAHDS